VPLTGVAPQAPSLFQLNPADASYIYSEDDAADDISILESDSTGVATKAVMPLSSSLKATFCSPVTMTPVDEARQAFSTKVNQLSASQTF
jgi:hypothetical protein